MKMSILLFVTVAGLGAVPASAQVMSAGDYVATAGAGDLYERTSSQIVLETTDNPKVRDFATMMMTAHAQSTAEVKAAALESKIKVTPPMLKPAQAELIAQLRVETGPARDAAYVAQQRAAHGQALAVQKAYAMDGAAPALKQAAGKIVPIVEHHIMMLMTM